MGLNDNFRMIRSQIMNMEPFPIISNMYTLIVKEKQKNVADMQLPSREAATFITKKGKGNKDKVSLHCDHHRKFRHNTNTYFKLIGYPNWLDKKEKP